MVSSRWGEQLNLVTLNITLLLSVACVDVDAIKPESQVLNLHADVLPSRLKGRRHADKLTRFSFQQASAAAGTSNNQNPWSIDPALNSFISRYNIPKVHGSGIKVDLGTEQDGYREPSGACPVFGKIIELYQPTGYPNNFLENAPTAISAKKPLSGGFNSPQEYAAGKPLSPVDDSWIQEKLGSAAPKTDVGRCAKYAYATVSVNPKTGVASLYKYPFVVDRLAKKCYVLAISAQQLSGQKYCSTYGSPAGLTWYCFEPKRNESEPERFIYGSAFIGRQNGDAWAASCPVEAVKGAMFGTWKNGKCTAYNEQNSVQTTTVTRKVECWKLVFENAGVANDQPETPSTAQTGLEDFWPSYTASAPKSGGHGVNWANFYTNSKGVHVCSLFNIPPDCFVTKSGAVAYTALGGFAETDLPQCDASQQTGDCVNCERLVYECTDNGIFQITESCCEPENPPLVDKPSEIPTTPPDDTSNATTPSDEKGEATTPSDKESEATTPSDKEGEATTPSDKESEATTPSVEKEEQQGTAAAAIAGGIVGGVLLLGLAAAAAGYYFRQPTPPPTTAREHSAVGGKEAHRASDVVASTDMSVWGEAADEGTILEADEPVETNF